MVSVAPAPLMVSEPGSFAEYTIVRRKPAIITEIIARNTYASDIVSELGAFGSEIASGLVAPLHEEASDAPFWHDAWRPWRGKTWRELPWFFAETYFYRRLLEVVRYFQPGPWHLLDPFEPQKREVLLQGLETLSAFHASLPGNLPLEEQFTLWLERSLWGNRADLSNAATLAKAHHITREDTKRLLINHTRGVWQLVAGGGVRRLDVVADNSGLELLSDLALLDFLLSHDLVDTAYLHLKGQPFFVSDAMVKDLTTTLTALRDAQAEELRLLGQRLDKAFGAGRLIACDHPFWTMCLPFRQFPDDLRDTLGSSDLILLKGDANYRRLIDDRHWPPTSDLATIAAHMPSSFLALRTLKGELLVGLPEGLAEKLASEDPTWLINGERGLIHLVQLPTESACRPQDRDATYRAY